MSKIKFNIAEWEERANGAGINKKAEYDVYNYAARGYVGYDLPYGFTPEAVCALSELIVKAIPTPSDNMLKQIILMY